MDAQTLFHNRDIYTVCCGAVCRAFFMKLASGTLWHERVNTYLKSLGSRNSRPHSAIGQVKGLGGVFCFRVMGLVTLEEPLRGDKGLSSALLLVGAAVVDPMYLSMAPSIRIYFFA